MMTQKRILQLLVATVAFLTYFPFSVDAFTSNPRRRPTHHSFRELYQSPDDDRPEFLSDGREEGSEAVENNVGNVSRRRALQTLMMATAAAALPAEPAFAGKPQFDKVTGELYSPKAEMLSGGSAAARGTGLSSTSDDSSRTKLKPGQALQTVYETRFIAYLARFLLTFDPAANAWWVQNTGSADTWDLGTGSMNTFRQGLTRDEVDAKFAEFAESVEIGLADYFVGPYGSYGSVTAARAGLSASQQVRSARPNNRDERSLGSKNNKQRPPKVLLGLFGNALENVFADKSKKEAKAKDRDSISKQGVLNLYTLLKARYVSIAAKRQLAILFSFFSNGDLQPTAEIQSLLGEADNATISRIDFVRPYPTDEATSRTSSRRGGGYSLVDSPTVTVDPPPALGSFYSPARAEAIMEPTSRVLRIRVIDGGEGYTSPPEVAVSSGDSQRVCSACAIVDREGRVESVLVLDPGYGYGKFKRSRQPIEPPKVVIAPPPAGSTAKGRRATTAAELEYTIVGVNITSGGNGFVSTEPPKIAISEPTEDPDWFVEVPELKVLLSEFGPVRAEVAQMKGPTGNLAYSIGDYPKVTRPNIPVDRILRDPTELLPSSVRPERNSLGEYIIPSIAAVPTYSTSTNLRYRAVDPLFGSIGSIPVTKSALELKPSEYGRLALSGAVCTVLVRTALNPLELIKTKQQLKNDEELLDFAQKRARLAKKVQDEAQLNNTKTGRAENLQVEASELKIGSIDLISSLVELRGPLALFQSADITFLASLMFGSFGFGATELFRRSFTTIIFNEGGKGNSSELILLLAATLATIITSFFAAPFELLRVRSMGLVEEKKWTEVLREFIDEKSNNGNDNSRRLIKQKRKTESKDDNTEFNLKDLDPQDLLPLWAGFPPTASRELAFAIPKFLVFDVLAKTITTFFNAQAGPGSLPIQVGVGTTGLAISAVAGAFAGIAGALVSHPADLILTYTSAAKKKTTGEGAEEKAADWRDVVKELLSREGGAANLFIGLTPRLIFFFLVIGLQFFLYDYVKTLLNVGSDDLSLVLDVFYAVRQGLIETL
jgi:hypothetical protein